MAWRDSEGSIRTKYTGDFEKLNEKEVQESYNIRVEITCQWNRDRYR